MGSPIVTTTNSSIETTTTNNMKWNKRVDNMINDLFPIILSNLYKNTQIMSEKFMLNDYK